MQASHGSRPALEAINGCPIHNRTTSRSSRSGTSTFHRSSNVSASRRRQLPPQSDQIASLQGVVARIAAVYRWPRRRGKSSVPEVSHRECGEPTSTCILRLASTQVISESSHFALERVDAFAKVGVVRFR